MERDLTDMTVGGSFVVKSCFGFFPPKLVQQCLRRSKMFAKRYLIFVFRPVYKISFQAA